MTDKQMNDKAEQYYEVSTFLIYTINDFSLFIYDIPVYINLNNVEESVFSDETVNIIGDFNTIYCKNLDSDMIVGYSEIEDLLLPKPREVENELDLKHTIVNESIVH